MRGGRRAAALVAATFLAASLAACGSGPEGDSKLTVYLSAPLSGERAEEGRDIADGARLALADAGGEAAGTEVELVVLDDARGRGWDAARTGANARTATQDSTAIAYIGELDSGATRTSLPITNEAGLLQVSPGAGAVDLTREAIGSDQVPAATQPSGSRTFGRVIPSDVAQGESGAVWMASAGVRTAAVFQSGDEFGDALVEGLRAAGDAPELVEGGSPAPATYYASDDLVVEGENVIPASGGIYGSDALLDQDDLTSLRILTEACRTRTQCQGRRREVRITSAALDPSQLPVEGEAFLEDFEAETGRAPGRYAAYGYEAMAVALDSIERAEDPLDRTSVRDAFFATAERESILGTYSIDEVGDTTLGSIGAYRVAAGRALPEREPIELP